MANTPIPITFNNVVKHPATYLLIIIVSLLWFFIYSFTGLSNDNNTTCVQEKAELRIELKAERQKNDNLINSILIKQGVIEKLTVITDSLTNKSNEHQ